MDKVWEKSFKKLFIESMAEMIETYFNPQFERIDKRFEQVDKRFEQVDQRFEKIDQRFKILEGRVGHLENQMVTKSYLDKKIAELKIIVV